MLEILVYKNGPKEFKIQVAEGSESPVTYQVIPKNDPDAPNGFQAMRTTKVLDPDISNITPLGFFDLERGVYDTAMTLNSKTLTKLYPNTDDRKTALRTITKHITNPLAEMRSLEQIDPSNTTFWDDFNVDVSVDLSFNTSDPFQLAKLFFLVIHGKLAPVGMESEHYFKDNAQYAVENKDLVINVGQKRNLDKNRAVTRFMTLLDSDKEGLAAILEWMGIPGLSQADEGLMNETFTHFLSRDENQNPKYFIDTCKNYYESNSGKQVLGLFRELRRLEVEKKVRRTVTGEIFLGETLLGKNMKNAAETVSKDTTLLEKVYALADA